MYLSDRMYLLIGHYWYPQRRLKSILLKWESPFWGVVNSCLQPHCHKCCGHFILCFFWELLIFMLFENTEKGGAVQWQRLHSEKSLIQISPVPLTCLGGLEKILPPYHYAEVLNAVEWYVSQQISPFSICQHVPSTSQPVPVYLISIPTWCPYLQTQLLHVCGTCFKCTLKGNLMCGTMSRDVVWQFASFAERRARACSHSRAWLPQVLCPWESSLEGSRLYRLVSTWKATPCASNVFCVG